MPATEQKIIKAKAEETIDVTLANGLRFVGERIERSQGVALALRVPAGSKDDPANKFGLAGLVKETLFKGTRKRDARALSDAFDFYGIRHSEYTGTESTMLQLRFLPGHLDKAMNLMRDVLAQPSFPEKECETAKIQALQELQHLEDSPLEKVFVILKELYFGSKWGHPDLGTEVTVPAITRGDMQAFWKSRYIPAGSVVAAAGKFDPQELIKHLETLFGNTGPAWPAQLPPPPPKGDVRHHSFKDTEQTQIALAFPAVPRNDPLSFAARIAVGVLSGGMSGRLFTEVREKRALVYSVGAQASSLRGSGVIYAYAGTTAARAAETVAVLKTELKRLGDDVTQEEIQRARVGVKAHMLMDQESTGARSRELLDDVYFEDRVVPMAEVVAKLDAVTVDDVKNYWTNHPVEPHTLVTLGRKPLD